MSIDGETASGRMEIAEGFVDRETYAVLPTGTEQYPELRGSSPADYSLDPDTPQRFDLDLWRMEVPEGVIYVDLLGRVEVDGDRLTYHVISARAKLIFNGGGSIGLPFPLFQEPGTVLVFER